MRHPVDVYGISGVHIFESTDRFESTRIIFKAYPNPKCWRRPCCCCSIPSCSPSRPSWRWSSLRSGSRRWSSNAGGPSWAPLGRRRGGLAGRDPWNSGALQGPVSRTEQFIIVVVSHLCVIFLYYGRMGVLGSLEVVRTTKSRARTRAPNFGIINFPNQKPIRGDDA